MPRSSRRLAYALIATAALAAAPLAAAEAEGWSWSQQHATVKPNGDLEWAPQPFRFVAGETLRYIDYETGDDSAPGTKDRPWKHHPWDRSASGQAKAHNGPTTYVFKRGVAYRGQLLPPKGASGTAEDPIRLTSDPAWGEGQASIIGSRSVTGWTKGGHGKMPSGDKAWHADVDCLPRMLWMVDGSGAITRLKLARTPNWEVTDPLDPHKDWWTWQNPWGNKFMMKVGKNMLHLGVDREHLTEDADYYLGAMVWTEWAIMMGTPYPTLVEGVDTDKQGIAFGGPWYRDSGTITTNNRYYLEDKPHYLDQAGEWWLDRTGQGGRLYLRLPDDVDPNTVRIEAGDIDTLFQSQGMSHVEISGLAFRFGNIDAEAMMQQEWHGGTKTRPAAIRIDGSGSDIAVRNCVFEHVVGGIRLSTAIEDRLHDVTISDNEGRFIDQTFLQAEGDQDAFGTLDRLRVLRNRIHEVGFRSGRPHDNFAITFDKVPQIEIAGNILTRCYGAGINGTGGKSDGREFDAPFSRVLIHHNKVADSLLSCNDWGGIEVWQGGPFYVYNNVSINPIGRMNWTGNNFGHAYYMDGAFKTWLFNNIAVGATNEPKHPHLSKNAFQSIHGWSNAIFNNTAWRFAQASNRQRPDAGRDKYLGNVFVDISEAVFGHAPKTRDPNAHHAGASGWVDYLSNAYAGNVLFDISGNIGEILPEHKDAAPQTLDAFAEALARVQAQVSEVGVMADQPPLRDPASGDFRPSKGSAAIDRGVKVFVPWALYADVGEWHFTRNHREPLQVIDEHWYLAPYYLDRTDYFSRPRYPLVGRNLDDDAFVAGELENWTEGALRLDGQTQHLVLAHAHLSKPYRYQPPKNMHGWMKRQGVDTGARTVQGTALKNVDIHDGNVLIEAYVRIDGGDQGVLVQKRDEQAGYVLAVTGGKLRLTLHQGGEEVAQRTSSVPVADGQWHHLVAEVERGAADGLRIYVDGHLANGPGTGGAPIGSLTNGGDFLVGGGPDLDHLACTIDFLRVSRGTLADARTSIEELHSWEFAGPHLRDFTGAEPTGAGRDAGAMEGR